MTDEQEQRCADVEDDPGPGLWDRQYFLADDRLLLEFGGWRPEPGRIIVIGRGGVLKVQGERKTCRWCGGEFITTGDRPWLQHYCPEHRSVTIRSRVHRGRHA